MSSIEYAGFWLRFVSFIIDALLLLMIYLLVILPLMASLDITKLNIDEMPPEQPAVLSLTSLTSRINTSHFVLIILSIAYYSLMESSRYQGSVGKLAMELKVANVRGKRLRFIKALLRNSIKIFLLLVFIADYLLIVLTTRKQTLHDLMSGAIVIKN